jgi:hypothetical protein
MRSSRGMGDINPAKISKKKREVVKSFPPLTKNKRAKK